MRKVGGENLVALESLTQQIQEQFAALEAGPLPAPGAAAPVANGTVGSPSSSSAPEEASSHAGGQVRKA